MPVKAPVALLMLLLVLCEAVMDEPDVAIDDDWSVEEDTLTVFAVVKLWLAVSDIVDDIASVVTVVVAVSVVESDVHTLESTLICNKRKNRKPVEKTDWKDR